jgi:hypothetical protein
MSPAATAILAAMSGESSPALDREVDRLLGRDGERVRDTERVSGRERDIVISARATQRTTFIATARFGPVRIDSARIDSVRRRRVGFENDNWDRASSRLRGDLGSPTSTLTVGVHRQYHSEFHGSPGTAGAHHAPPRVGRVVAISSDESGKNEKGQRGRRPHGSRRPPRFFPIALRRPPIALP